MEKALFGALEETTSVELSDALLERVDALVEHLCHTDLGLHVELTRDLVIRLALIRGIEELERGVAS